MDDDDPQRLNAGRLEEIADGFMLHQPERERVHYLNHTAVVVLELCEAGLSPEEVVLAVQELYDLPRPPAEEVGTCLDALRKQGLIA